MAKKGKQVKVDEQDVLETRSSIPNFALDQISHAQKLALMADSPFYNLLSSKAQSASIVTCKAVLECFDVNEKAFFFKGKCCVICEEEAALVLGMRNEGLEFEYPGGGEGVRDADIPLFFSNLIKTVKSSDGKLLIEASCKEKVWFTKSNIQLLLQHMAIDDDDKKLIFKKLMYYYLLNFVVYPNSESYSRLMFFECVKDTTTLDKVNWAKVMLKHLLTGIGEYKARNVKNTKYHLLFFPPLLESWFYYRTDSSVDDKLKDNEAPIKFFKSVSRTHLLDSIFQSLNVKKRCRLCQGREEALEIKKGEDKEKVNETVGESEIKKGKDKEKVNETRVKEINLRIRLLESHATSVCNDIGNQLLDFAISSVLKFAKDLGFKESKLDLLMLLQNEFVGEDIGDGSPWPLLNALTKVPRKKNKRQRTGKEAVAARNELTEPEAARNETVKEQPVGAEGEVPVTEPQVGEDIGDGSPWPLLNALTKVPRKTNKRQRTDKEAVAARNEVTDQPVGAEGEVPVTEPQVDLTAKARKARNETNELPEGEARPVVMYKVKNKRKRTAKEAVSSQKGDDVAKNLTFRWVEPRPLRTAESSKTAKASSNEVTETADDESSKRGDDQPTTEDMPTSASNETVKAVSNDVTEPITCPSVQSSKRGDDQPTMEDIPTSASNETVKAEPPVSGKDSAFAACSSGVIKQWVQCVTCSKWRTIPADSRPSPEWKCAYNVWDSSRWFCSSPEEPRPRELDNFLILCKETEAAAKQKMLDFEERRKNKGFNG